MNKKFLKNYRDLGVIDKFEHGLCFDKVNTFFIYIVAAKDLFVWP
jgi:hypothetical protein